MNYMEYQFSIYNQPTAPFSLVNFGVQRQIDRMLAAGNGDAARYLAERSNSRYMKWRKDSSEKGRRAVMDRANNDSALRHKIWDTHERITNKGDRAPNQTYTGPKYPGISVKLSQLTGMPREATGEYLARKTVADSRKKLPLNSLGKPTYK